MRNVSATFTNHDTGPAGVFTTDGASMVTAGGVLSAVNVALGPAGPARCSASSEAVAGAIEMPSVPSPRMSLRTTTRVLPVPSTVTLADAVPVAFPVQSAAD